MAAINNTRPTLTSLSFRTRGTPGAYLFGLVVLFLLHSCGGGSGTKLGSATNYTIQIAFERIETGTLNPFRVTASIFENGQAKSGIGNDISITLGRGSRNAVTEVASG